MSQTPTTSTPMTATPTTSAPTSVAALEADIAVRRERLARTIDELTAKARPQAIARRQAESAKARFAAATQTPDGDLRTERIAALVLAALALVTLGVLRRRRRG